MFPCLGGTTLLSRLGLMHFSSRAMDLVDVSGAAVRMKETDFFSAVAREKNLPRYAKVTGIKIHCGCRWFGAVCADQQCLTKY